MTDLKCPNAGTSLKCEGKLVWSKISGLWRHGCGYCGYRGPTAFKHDGDYYDISEEASITYHQELASQAKLAEIGEKRMELHRAKERVASGAYSRFTQVHGIPAIEARIEKLCREVSEEK